MKMKLNNLVNSWKSLFALALVCCMLVALATLPEKVYAADNADFCFELADSNDFSKIKGATGQIYIVRDKQIVATYPVTEYQSGYSSTAYKATIDKSLMQENDLVYFDMNCDGYLGSLSTMHGLGKYYQTLEEVVASPTGRYLSSWLNDTSYMMTATLRTKDIECGTYDSWEKLISDMSKVLANREKGNHIYRLSESLSAKLKSDGMLTYLEGYNVWDLADYAGYDFYSDQLGSASRGGDYYLNNYIGGALPGADDEYTISCCLNTHRYQTTSAQEADFDRKLASLFATGGALAHTKNLSKVEAVVEFMKYINANVQGVSSYDYVDHSGYGALCKGKATCQGKSMLLYRMLREVGIANRIVMGMDAAAHTYNLVLIDGKYYYTDPSTTNVILKGTNSFKPAELQPQYLTDIYKNNILSKLSATDYPLPSSGSGSGNSGAGNTQNNNTPNNSTPNNNTSNNNNASNNNATNNDATQNDDTQQEYKVLDGANSTYDVESQEFSLRAEGALEKFVSVEVDGKEVDKKYYTVKEGSTIVIFTKEFMDTLAEGEHSITFNFTDGKASTNIQVAAKTPATEDVEDASTEAVTEDDLAEETENKDANKTDNAKPDKEEKGGIPTIVWVLLVLVLVAAGVAGVILYRKKSEGGSEA